MQSAKLVLLRLLWRKPEVAGGPGGVFARTHVEFGQDCRHVMIHSLGRHEQLIGDLGVGSSGDNQVEHLHLAGRQTRGIGPGGATRTAGDLVYAETLQFAANQPGGRSGPEAVENL